MKFEKFVWGEFEGKQIHRIDLINDHGASVSLIEFGARLISVVVPDRDGNLDDVVLGYDNLSSYIDDENSFGATNGRVSNRIEKGNFSLNGENYFLDRNLGQHHIHGGYQGFKRKVWSAHPEISHEDVSVELRYISADGEDGYPGEMTVRAKYSWNNDNQLRFEVEASCDKSCPVNITQHAYFNLSGKLRSDALMHHLKINASHRLVYRNDGIPTGTITENKKTPYDFMVSNEIGEAIEQNFGGFDLNYILNAWQKGQMVSAAELTDPLTGRVLKISTTRPGLQLYTADHLSGCSAKNGMTYHKHAGVSLEPQYYPDSIHHEQFPNTVLEPGKVFKEVNLYEFI